MATPPIDPHAFALATSRYYGHGIYLGCTTRPASGVPLFARPQDGVLLLGPPRSGKTAAVVVPNVLAACGPVVAASTKADVLAATWAARSELGPALLYDPSGTVACPAGVVRVGWSPLGLARTWDGAVLVAESMVRSARPGSERGEVTHWSERASALLASLLHAGALQGQLFRQVLGAVNRHSPDESLAGLARHGADRALDVLEGIVATDSREQSGIWSTAAGVLAGYRTDAALASTEGRLLDLDDLLKRRGTLYVCAGSDQQRQAAPLVTGLLREVRSAAYQLSRDETVAASIPGGGQSLPRTPLQPGPPLLLVLDELANIAPLHDLPALVAEGGSQGILTLACLQDLAQARARWEREADGFMSLFGTKLVFPGIGDTRTLEAVSLLSGEHEVPTVSVSEGPRRRGLGVLRRNTTADSLDAKRAGPSRRRHRPGPPRSRARHRGARAAPLQMTPWYSSSPWREDRREQPTLARRRHGPGCPGTRAGRH